MAEILITGKREAVKRQERLGIFLLDGSGSMADIGDNNCSLAENVNRMLQYFFSGFKESAIREEFEIAIINFDHEAIVRLPRTPLVDLDDFMDFNPMDKSKNYFRGTDIGAGLRKAKEIIDAYFAQPNLEMYRRTVSIAILSDGMCNHPDETIKIARELGVDPRITISCGLFTAYRERNDDLKNVKDFLQNITSETGGVYGPIRGNATLKKFFYASIIASIHKEQTDEKVQI
jgi:uncharacterized protein YegL